MAQTHAVDCTQKAVASHSGPFGFGFAGSEVAYLAGWIIFSHSHHRDRTELDESDIEGRTAFGSRTSSRWNFNLDSYPQVLVASGPHFSSELRYFWRFRKTHTRTQLRHISIISTWQIIRQRSPSHFASVNRRRNRRRSNRH